MVMDVMMPGVGLDLRRRKIWESFSGIADLREEAITPTYVRSSFVPLRVDEEIRSREYSTVLYVFYVKTLYRFTLKKAYSM
jgi:hypothetical protein